MTSQSARAPEAGHDPFAGNPIERIVPSTDAQREIWLADQLGRESSLAYNESASLTWEGPLDEAALGAAVQDVADRHDALRGTLSPDGEHLLIYQRMPVAMTSVDARAAGRAAADALLQAERRKAVEEPFQINHGPLLRATLVRISETTAELILTAHHIVCDGWSLGVIASDLVRLYEARVHAAAATPGVVALPPADSYGTYALAQRGADGNSARAADERYWVNAFEAPSAPLDLPADSARPIERTFASQRIDLAIEPALVERARQWGAAHGASPFTTLCAAFAGLMSRISGNEEVVIGIPAAGQAFDDHPGLVGHCVSLLPVRVAVDVNEPASKLLNAMRSAVLDAYDHPHCTLGHLLTKLQIAREPGRLPLVSVLFNLDQAISDIELPKLGVNVSVSGNPRRFENFEIFLNVSQRQQGWLLECQYNTTLFSSETITRWLTLFREALHRLSSGGTLTLADAFAPTAAEQVLLQQFNATEQVFDGSLRIDDLIGRQVERAPLATAIVSGSSRITYQELEHRAANLAAVLIEQGVRPGDLVGIFCDRSERMLIALYGILKAGAGYVPLDATFPAARLAFMVADSKLRVVVTDRDSDARALLGDVRLIAMDGQPSRKPDSPRTGTPDDIAYVIYTSGSTGRPKGVCVPHRTAVNLLHSLRTTPGMRADHVVLAVTTIAFDISVSEVLAPLTIGATVVVADRTQAQDGGLLKELITRTGVTFIDATPATWRLLVDAGWQGRQDLVAICTGEPLPPDLGRSLLPLVGELWNGYGPTETTVWSSFQRVLSIDGAVPIGRPVANTQFHVCDSARRLLPVGAIGELFISGKGVTDGYLDRPELTAERFVASADETWPGKWYRSGDLGRWRGDGTLECLGRVDHQVKVRGYRIELGEIESVLAAQPHVQRALVVTREDVPGDVRIVAYVVPDGEAPDYGALRLALGRQLPEYMLPQHFITLPAIPLLPNGKIDRKALPDPATTASPARRERIAPRSDVESVVLAAIEDVLRLPALGVTDDFFELGGHSLLVAKVTSRLNRDFGISMPLRTLFESRTAEGLAVAVGEAQRSEIAPRIQIRHDSARRTAPLTVMQERIRFIEELRPGLVAYNTPSAHRLKGPLNVELFELAFRDVVQRQPALRTYIGTGADGASHAQHVVDVLDFAFPYEDLSGVPEAVREDQLLSRMQLVIDAPIAITAAPLFRVVLYRLAHEHHALLFVPHHIIWDGWSFDLLYEEIAAAYEARLKRSTNTLPGLSVTYPDYAVWHHEWLNSAAFETEYAYWKKRLATIGDPPALATDRPRRAGMMSGEGASEWVRVDKVTTEKLRAIAVSADVTLSTLTMALFAGLLSEATGHGSVVLGVPVRGRQSAELENVMGFFNNLLPVQLHIDRDQRATTVAGQIKQELLDVFSHQTVPFERLAEVPALAARSQRHGSYQALFSFQDARDRIRRWGNVTQSSILVFQKGATEDLGLWLMEVPSGLEGGLIYDADLFTAETARAFREAFLAAINNLVGEASRTIAQVIDKRPLEAVAKPSPVRPEDLRVKTGSANSLATRREPATTALEGTAGAIARLWAELLNEDARLLRDTDTLTMLGAGRDVVALAAQRSSGLLGFAMDPARYGVQTVRQLAQAADLLGGAAATVDELSDGEKVLRGIWAELLDIDADQITGGDNFFDLGGSSLLAMRAIDLSSRSLGFRVDARRYLSESMSQLAIAPLSAQAGE